MRACPECGTQYEDHVDTCLIDGVSLPEPAAEVVVAAPASAEAASGGGGRGGLIALVLIGLALLIVGVGVVAFLTIGGGAPPEPPVPAPAPPPATPAPQPVVAPPQPTRQLAMVTTPVGASVVENGRTLCATPCNVEHPADAPLPRTFTFELDQHEPLTASIDDPDAGPFVFELVSMAPAPVPRPTTRPSPAPAPVPAATPRPVRAGPRPSIHRDR